MKSALFQRVLASQREFPLAQRIIASVYGLKRAGTRVLRRTLYDTFDQRLFRAGRWLELDVNHGVRVLLRAAGTAATGVAQTLSAPPDGPLTLPSGAAGDTLAPLLGGRALLPRISFDVRATDWSVVDADGKIRATLTREQIRDRAPDGRERTRLTVLRLTPLRGYESTCRDLMDELGKVLSGDSGETDPAAACLARARGPHPAPPVNAPLPLRPRQSAARALGLILLGQLRIMEANVDGIRADTDTEFLHDFRIACRRSRSLLTQVRGAFPPHGTAPFKESFAWLSRVTSPQRDLDVFLAAMPVLAESLSGRHAGALAPLRDLLVCRRREEHERLVETMAGARFREFLPRWRAWLSGFAGPRAPRLQSPPYVLEAANTALRRLYRRLLRDGARCGAGAYSADLHELRKDGKKLRYLLEAFRTLYPPDEVDTVVRRLRKLQNVLGEIVDCHVQREWLQSWQQEFLGRPDTDPATLAAMAELGAVLDRLESRAQQDFARRFGQFDAAPVHEAMDRLLGQRP
jgi:CHAD domain-containing protein